VGTAVGASVPWSSPSKVCVAGSFDELQKRLDQMELDIGARLSEHDEQLRQIFEALRQLIAPPPSTKRPIGFRVREK
jgi:hypothetical protein